MNQTSDWLGLVQQGSPSGQEGTLQAVRTRLQTVWLLQARLTARLTDSNYTLRDWFSRVPLVARRELYRLYEPDFRLGQEGTLQAVRTRLQTVWLLQARLTARLTDSNYTLRDWFSRVPLVARRELYRLYEPDFRLGQEGTLQAVRTRLQTVWLLQARLTARLTDSNYTLRDWFSRVPLVARRELYRLYEPDFRLFGYSRPDSLLD
ncbi:unnamed protein product [Coregonus sp. 'balchen']|nr:unnamed protein product [Coregonus sp. 'balchen']CAB1350373.1 unnamed protein product [Coregonus sp. 'balchen']